MKKITKSVLLACVCGLMLTGCGKKEDVITNLSYTETAYTLQYDYFNSEKVYQFELLAGDTLHLESDCSEGSIDVKIVDIDDVELYHEEFLVSMAVDIPIEKSGRYIVVMTGKETTGGVQMYVVKNLDSTLEK